MLCPTCTEDVGGAGGCRHHWRRLTGQQEPLLTSPHGREKKDFTGVPSAATKYLKRELSAEVGSHGNVSSAVSPKEHTEEGVALLYLLKHSSSSPSLCSPFPIPE